MLGGQSGVPWWESSRWRLRWYCLSRVAVQFQVSVGELDGSGQRTINIYSRVEGVLNDGLLGEELDGFVTRVVCWSLARWPRVRVWRLGAESLRVCRGGMATSGARTVEV